MLLSGALGCLGFKGDNAGRQDPLALLWRWIVRPLAVFLEVSPRLLVGRAFLVARHTQPKQGVEHDHRQPSAVGHRKARRSRHRRG